MIMGLYGFFCLATFSNNYFTQNDPLSQVNNIITMGHLGTKLLPLRFMQVEDPTFSTKMVG
jgi:hypothetical protein